MNTEVTPLVPVAISVPVVASGIPQAGPQEASSSKAEPLDGGRSYERKLDLKFAEADRLAALSAGQRQLYRRLSLLRLRLARDALVPAYQVIGNQGLLNLCEQRPLTEAALKATPGVGQMRLRAYGAELLAVLNASANSGNTLTS